MSEKIGSVIKDDSLSMLVRMQKELMDVIKNRTGTLPSLSDVSLAMVVEIGEWANVHAEFKKWKLNHEYDRQKALEEFVDILFFWLQAMIMQNFTVLDVIEEYVRKYEVNVRRQESGY